MRTAFNVWLFLHLTFVPFMAVMAFANPKPFKSRREAARTIGGGLSCVLTVVCVGGWYVIYVMRLVFGW